LPSVPLAVRFPCIERTNSRLRVQSIAELIAAAHRDQGVDRHVGRKVDQVNEGALRLDDGTLLDADLVVVGIGVAPRFGRDLSTAVPDIFAARTSLAGLIATAADAFALSTG
jgi:apoptosis-inducing factor 3